MRCRVVGQQHEESSSTLPDDAGLVVETTDRPPPWARGGAGMKRNRSRRGWMTDDDGVSGDSNSLRTRDTSGVEAQERLI